MDNLLIIKKYKDEDEEVWDDFVKEGVLATIYHTRKFINYHPKDRFVDNSTLVYLKNELICVVPACKKRIPNTNNVIIMPDGDIEIDPSEFTTCAQDKYFSYMGSTYGGPVFLRKYFETRYVSIILNEVLNYYHNRIEFRIANDIYFEDNIFMVYSLLGSKMRMVPELSWYIDTDDDFLNNICNKRNKSHLLKIIDDQNIVCSSTDDIEDYRKFYNILEDNLSNRHNTQPTHSLEEFLKLKSILNDNGKLYLVKEKEEILGGVYIIKVTSLCWYTFYITKNIAMYDNNAVIPYLMYTISKDAKNNDVKYVDYGICVEDRGNILNIGLADFKERSLGGKSNARYLFLM